MRSKVSDVDTHITQWFYQKFIINLLLTCETHDPPDRVRVLLFANILWGLNLSVSPLVENCGGSGLTEYPVAYISGSTSLAIILVLLLVYKLCCAKLCAEYFFSARLWIYKVVWYLTVSPPFGNQPTIITAWPLCLLRTYWNSARNPRVGTALLDIQEF